MPDTAAWALPALFNLALAILLGGWLSMSWLEPRHCAWQQGAYDATRTLMRWSLAAGALLLSAMLWSQAALMGDVALTEAAPFVWVTLSSSHVGAMWCISLGAGLLLAVSSELVAAPAAARVGSAAALLLLAASRAAVSHAVDRGVLSWAVGFDTLHLLCVGAWVGIVIVAGVSFARGRVHHADTDIAAAQCYLQALSHTATIALAGVVVSGGYNLWRTLSAIPARFDQPWLIWLMIKLILVVVAVALGAVNRWSLLPKILTQAGLHDAQLPQQARLLRILQSEAVVLALTMAAAAILSASAPPGVT